MRLDSSHSSPVVFYFTTSGHANKEVNAGAWMSRLSILAYKIIPTIFTADLRVSLMACAGFVISGWSRFSPGIGTNIKTSPSSDAIFYMDRALHEI